MPSLKEGAFGDKKKSIMLQEKREKREIESEASIEDYARFKLNMQSFNGGERLMRAWVL